MGSEQNIVRGVLWSTLSNVINAIYGFIAVPILINHFGKAEYGLIGLAMSINVYLNLMDMGFNSTNVRFFSNWLANKDYIRLKKGFQTSLFFYGFIGIINVIVLLIVSLFSDVIFNVTPEQGVVLKHLLYILSISAFCQWFSSCFDQLIKATENIAWVQQRTLITKFLMIIVLLATVYLSFTIELYYFLTCLATLSIIPMYIAKIKKDTPFISFKPKWDNQAFKEMLPYCMNIFSFSIFQFSFYNLRPVFLGIQSTVESVADYRILNGIIGVVTMLGSAFIGILLPSTSKAVASHNLQAYYRVAYDGTKYISIMLCFCCFAMMTVGQEVLTLYVGNEYLYLLPWFNVWLLCTLGTHNQAISSLILAGNDIRAISYSSAFASVFGLIIAWILIPHYDIGGVSIAYAAYMVILLAFFYIYYWPYKMKISSLKVFKECFIPFVLSGIAISSLLQFLSLGLNTFYMLFIKAGIFTIIYGIFVWIYINRNDRQFIIRMLKR